MWPLIHRLRHSLHSAEWYNTKWRHATRTFLDEVIPFPNDTTHHVVHSGKTQDCPYWLFQMEDGEIEELLPYAIIESNWMCTTVVPSGRSFPMPSERNSSTIHTSELYSDTRCPLRMPTERWQLPAMVDNEGLVRVRVHLGVPLSCSLVETL